MWKRVEKVKKVDRLEEAIERIHSGEADAVRGTAEYRGRDYIVEVKPKGTVNEPPPGSIHAANTLPMIDALRLSHQLEEVLFGPRVETTSHTEQMPWLTLPAGYSFKVTFPFSGAAARFHVCKTDRPDKSVSVYLDTKDVLGSVGSPYWEAYPIDGDPARFLLGEGHQLIAAIVAELDTAA